MRASFGVTAVGFDDLLQLKNATHVLLDRLLYLHKQGVVYLQVISIWDKTHIRWIIKTADQEHSIYPIKIPEGITPVSWHDLVRAELVLHLTASNTFRWTSSRGEPENGVTCEYEVF